MDQHLPSTPSVNRPRPLPRWPLCGVLFAALLARVLVAFGLLGGMPLYSDARSYADEAAALLAHFPPAKPFYWPPGNGLVLAAGQLALGWPAGSIAGDLFAIRLTLVLLSLLSVLLLVLLTARVAGPRIGLLTGLLAALYPPSVMLAGQSYSQHLAALCLLGVAYSGLRGVLEPDTSATGRIGHLALIGLWLGLGTLTRPSMLSIGPVLLGIGVWGLWRLRGGTARLALAAGGLVAVLVAGAWIAPVLRHNHALGAGYTISTNNERNFFLGNNPYTHPYKTSHLGQRHLSQLPPDVRAYLQEMYQRPDARAEMKREALAFIKAHPALTAQRTLSRIRSYWGFDYIASRVIQGYLGVGMAGLLPLLALEAGGYVALMLLAFVGICCLSGRTLGGASGRIAGAPALWLVGLVVWYQVPYMIAFSGGTYHFPGVWLLMPFAGLALGALLDGSRRAAALTAMRRSKWLWAAWILFLLVQVEYAFYAISMDG